MRENYLEVGHDQIDQVFDFSNPHAVLFWFFLIS